MDGNSYLHAGNRSFYVHFKSEQAKLDRLLADIRDELRLQRQRKIDAAVARKLGGLCEVLADHFREEQEGCFDELVAQRPALAPQTRHMESEHGRLLSHLNEIVAFMKKTGDTMETRRRFDHFHAEMVTHERRERQLLQTGLALSDAD